MLDTLPRPIIFGHRGASSHAPENTMSAFKLAEAEGADAIELDAQLSSDGHVVVHHDPTVERTTNGRGRLSNMTLSELRALDAGSHFSEKYQGERIPLLEEVFDAIRGRLLINVDFRNHETPHDALVAKVCELVRKHALEGSVIFSSFLPSNLAKAARLLSNVPRALVARPGWPGAWARSFAFSFGDYAALHAFNGDVSPQQVRRVHRLRRRLHVWTVNSAKDLRRLTDWGADGVFTDDPKMAVDELRAMA